MTVVVFFFFFQAEDGIRDIGVTGVQTCALPICQLDAIRDSEGIVGLNFNCGFLHPEGNRGSDLALDVMVDHLDALIERLGDDKVGLGSDFDGATMPEGIRDVSLLPNLIEAMRARGYDDAAIRKIAYGNWLRVMEIGRAH